MELLKKRRRQGSPAVIFLGHYKERDEDEAFRRGRRRRRHLSASEALIPSRVKPASDDECALWCVGRLPGQRRTVFVF